MSDNPELERDRLSPDPLLAELRAAGAQDNGKHNFRCPYHDDKHASAGIYTGPDGVWKFKCQSSTCRAGGMPLDVYDLRAMRLGVDPGKLLSDAMDAAKAPPPTAAPVRIFPTLDALTSALPGKVALTHRYTDPATGKDDMVVYRLAMPDGGKSYRPAMPAPGGWVLRAPSDRRPLYARDRIAAARNVIVVEGEKCADAINALPGLAERGWCATTSPGGAEAADKTDWSPIGGKRAFLWPDNDEAGSGYALAVQNAAERLLTAVSLHVLKPSELGLGAKEDAYDWIAGLKGVEREQIAPHLIEAVEAASIARHAAAELREYQERIISGEIEMVPWMHPTFGRMTKATLPSTIMILCGSPGATKSLWTIENMAWWYDRGYKPALYALEEKRRFHLLRLLAMRSGNSQVTDFDWMRTHPAEARRIMDEHESWLAGIGRHISAAETRKGDITLEAMSRWAREQAESGSRIIIIDPISLAEKGRNEWQADKKFMNDALDILNKHDVTLYLVTHPRKAQAFSVAMDDLQGGASYSRASQTIVWLEAVDPEERKIVYPHGVMSERVNRVMHLCKTRNAASDGATIGFWFDRATLCTQERGLIQREPKKKAPRRGG
jgi:KaiC/GvpD/RAD55 family RecA-like ATPase